jgi:hypothetical protein
MKKEKQNKIVECRLDYGLHKNPGVNAVVGDQRLFHN